MAGLVGKRFESLGEVREFTGGKGRVELVDLNGHAIGRVAAGRALVRVALCLGSTCAVLALLSAGTAWAMTSTFQAGYQASHDAFRSVHASWVMPSISCPGESSPGYDGEAWFGVGKGPSNSRAEQVVARAFCTGTIASYVAYFEVGGPQATGSAGGVLTPYPGDRLTASVTYLGVFPSGSYHLARYRFSITDFTHPKSFTLVDSTDCLAQSCDHSTAEVTAGIPFAGYSALAHYGNVVFSGTGITDTKRHRGSFAKNQHWKVARLVEFDTSTHSLAASPSALTHHGTQFSDSWRAY